MAPQYVFDPTTALVDLVRARRMGRTGEARALRQRAGLSQGEIAATVGVSTPTVQRWELGERSPHGEPGSAYGRLLAQLQEVVGRDS